MGRSPCCDKAKVKKGPWSPEEDTILKSYLHHRDHPGNWISLPQKIGLNRCGKSCRLRWLNYLRPNIKHGGFSEEEDNIIFDLYMNIGSRWSIIAAQLPGRTDNDIKNYWNTKLKKKVVEKQRREQQTSRRVKQEIMERENDNNFMASNQAMNIPFNTNYLVDQTQNSTNFQYSIDNLHANSMNSSVNDTFSRLSNAHFLNNFQGFNNFAIDDQLDEIVYNSANDQQLDELLCEVQMLNGSSSGSGISSTQSSNWGDTSSLMCPSVAISELPY
ncbi:hypothetical protein LguiB_033295 [Lonicera macranthoides]